MVCEVGFVAANVAIYTIVEQLQVNVATGSLTEDNTEQAVLLYCIRESLWTHCGFRDRCYLAQHPAGCIRLSGMPQGREGLRRRGRRDQ